MKLTLAALAPVVVVESWARGIGWIALLLAAIALAMAFTLLARRPPREKSLPVATDLDAAIAATLVLLLLPAGTAWSIACLAVALAISVGRQAFGGLGQPLFHPAMVGLALTGLLWPAGMTAPAWSGWAAAAVWIGGSALVLRGVLPWRLPSAFFAGALVAAAFMVPSEVSPVLRALAVASDPSWELCAFFIAGDSTTACLHAGARLAFGIGAGVLVVLLSSWQPGIGLPLAMLLMNFTAPWLDQIDSTRRQKIRSP